MKDESYFEYLWLKIERAKGLTLSVKLHFCKDCGHITIDLFRRTFSLILYTRVINDMFGEGEPVIKHEEIHEDEKNER